MWRPWSALTPRPQIKLFSFLYWDPCLRKLNTCREDRVGGWVRVRARVHHSMCFSASRVVCQVPVIPGIRPKHLSPSRCRTSKSAVVKSSSSRYSARIFSLFTRCDGQMVERARVSQRRWGSFASLRAIHPMNPPPPPTPVPCRPVPAVQASARMHGCRLTFWQEIISFYLQQRLLVCNPKLHRS